MGIPVEITYLGKSGFALCLGDTLLVFDEASAASSEGEGLCRGGVSAALVQSMRRTVFLISHSHAGHFHPEVFRFKEIPGVSYILGDDDNYPEECPGIRVRPGDVTAVEDVLIRAFDSTDKGVSFLVQKDGWNLFHAGDLNFWHWREKTPARKVMEAEAAFEACITPLCGRNIDIAFFPVDPRMGELHAVGAEHFCMLVQPGAIIPMHWQERPEVAETFRMRNHFRYTQVITLTEPGMSARAEKNDAGIVFAPCQPYEAHGDVKEASETENTKSEATSEDPWDSRE